MDGDDDNDDDDDVDGDTGGGYEDNSGGGFDDDGCSGDSEALKIQIQGIGEADADVHVLALPGRLGWPRVVTHSGWQDRVSGADRPRLVVVQLLTAYTSRRHGTGRMLVLTAGQGSSLALNSVTLTVEA
ncbi:hypothetical protein ElyMa_002269600 [Elysia marginata]|uniref:Uncharacterized protein n=1 Tax=Elysia marginata TaxID=1093978 RepID=A0AAV4G119_9GAST|nr:hypothetical protein ElyMa_002269600 [Elysia marginata]